MKHAWWVRGFGVLDDLTGEVRPEDPGPAAHNMVVEQYNNQCRWRRSKAADCLTLYLGTDAHDLAVGSANSIANDFVDAPEPPGYNVIGAIVDTKTAHIVQNKVRTMFLTEKGNAELQDKARLMQQACEAVRHENGFVGGYNSVSTCFDGQLFEAGCVKITPDYANMRVSVERIMSFDTFVSNKDARTGKPHQMGHGFMVDRSVLAGMFSSDTPEDAERRQWIADASNKDINLHEPLSLESTDIADELFVAELWHLPTVRVDRSKPEAFGLDENGLMDPKIDPGHDGRRMMLLGEKVLIDEPWPFDYFPIATFRPMQKPVGFWSQSIPEMLAGAQLAINRMSDRIDRIMHLHARPLLYVWKAAKMNTSKITNALAQILEGNMPAGQAMQYITPQAVGAEYIQQIDKIIGWCEKRAGISELSIAAQKPPGINHAPGLQHLSDTESIRHTPAFYAWEQFHVDMDRAIVDCMRLLGKHAKTVDKKFEVVFGDSKEMLRLNWEDFDLAENQYHITRWPTNMMPAAPAAKISRAMDLKELAPELLTNDVLAMLLEYPDIAAALGDKTAFKENIQRKLDKVQKDGMTADDMPHSYLSLELALEMTAERINRLEADGGTPEHLDDLIKFYEAVDKLKQDKMKALAPPPPPGPPGGGGLPLNPHVAQPPTQPTQPTQPMAPNMAA